VDKSGQGWLTNSQLHRFCKLVVPDVSPGQVRYLQVILDHDGDGRVSFHDIQHLATISKHTGLAFPVKNQLDATDVLKCAALFMYDKRLSCREFYSRFDENSAERVGKRGIATMIRVVMKAASKAETTRLASEFMQVFDHDCDGAISPAEFEHAMQQGEPLLPMLDDIWAAIDMRQDFTEGQVLTSNSLARLSSEHAVLREAEASGSPLSLLLQQISSLTGGRSRKLDMGSAKAAAQHINQSSMLELHSSLKVELKLCNEFETAYAARLNLERAAGDDSTPAAEGQAQQTVHEPGGAPTLATAVQAANRAHAARQVRSGSLCSAGIDKGNAGRWSSPRPAHKIPMIGNHSNLLADTCNRMHYMMASIEQNGRLASMANDITSRSCAYPASGPGPLKPVPTGWDRRRQKFEDGDAGRRTCILFRGITASDEAGLYAPGNVTHPGSRRSVRECAWLWQGSYASSAHLQPSKAELSGQHTEAAERFGSSKGAAYHSEQIEEGRFEHNFSGHPSLEQARQCFSGARVSHGTLMSSLDKLDL
jgi:Ca2+-binding EF-hand superfamily protein